MAHNSSHVNDNPHFENTQCYNNLDHGDGNSPSLRGLPSRPAGRAACVIDLDNLCSRRGQRGRRAWAYLDVVALITALRRRGVTNGIVFQNQRPGAYGSKLWAAGGLKCIATGSNVDDRVKLATIDYALAGLDSLILVASDGGYDEVIHAIRSCAVRVELWALRAAVAKHLLFAADAVRWIDDLVQEPVFDGPSNRGQELTCPRIAA